jgi:hypothetical protein
VIAQRAFELVLGVNRVEGADDRADLPGAELGDRKLRTVRQQQRDAIAAPDPERRERRRAGVAQSIELAPGDRRAFEEQRRLRGPLARDIREVVEKGPIRIRRQRPRDAGVVMRLPVFSGQGS